MMNPQDVDIRTLLPQRDPIVMVDRLSAADALTAETALTIQPDNLFVESGKFKSYAMVEVMAQTCAAHLGYVDKYILGHNGLRIGYIGSVKKMQVESVPRVGEMLRTCIRILEDFGDMKMAAAECYIDDRRVASAELVITLAGERTTV